MKVDHRPQRQPAGLGEIAQAGNAHGDGGEDGGGDHHLDELDEQVRHPLHLRAGVGRQNADGDADGNADQHPEIQVMPERLAGSGRCVGRVDRVHRGRPPLAVWALPGWWQGRSASPITHWY